ncbi:MAG: ComF family protein [Candidatus Moranbacteria bacterium]|nr:ComF family protein [Candidatus Moranbacteria bacterium]
MSLSATIKTTILDIVFPIACVGCKQPKTFLCDTCLAHIPIRIDQVCPVCEKRNTLQGQVCLECLGRSSLDGLLVASSYKHLLLSKAIHLYKYRFIPTLSHPLGRLLLQSVTASEIPLPDMLCPVPLHPLRLRWRGFNQSELLAQELSEKLVPQIPIPLTNGLVRSRFTMPQMSIRDTRERNQNILDAFAWKSSLSETDQDIQNKYIWLIDDVATTASTLNECARILKQNGAKKVFGVVLAR